MMKVCAGFICLVLVLGCSTHYEPAFTTIEFGSGGGFTGEYIAYNLRHDGALSKYENGLLVQIKTVDASTISQIEMLINALGGYSYNHPSNMTEYIYIRGLSDRYYAWPMHSMNIDARLLTLNQKLNSLID